ncbi:MAG: PLDc N-terminal domain-containing protein [Alphaproteobacteria bacterium]
MDMYGISGIIILVLDIFAIIQVLQSSLPPINKLIGVLLILALPVLGLILWLLIGIAPARCIIDLGGDSRRPASPRSPISVSGNFPDG